VVRAEMKWRSGRSAERDVWASEIVILSASPRRPQHKSMFLIKRSTIHWRAACDDSFNCFHTLSALWT